MVRALLLAAGAAGAAAWYPAQLPEYQCIYHQTIGGQLYSWDFASLYRTPGSEYAVNQNPQDPTSAQLQFNICGMVSSVCAPQAVENVDPYYSHGMAVQFLEPAKNSPGGTCKDVDCVNDPTCPQTQQSVPCTGNCEVVAHYENTAPGFTLTDVNNVNGGINLTYAGVPAWANDPFECDTDPNTLLPAARKLTIQIGCDKSVSGLNIQSFSEPTGCSYVIQATSKAACPSKGDPFDPYRDDPAHSFGFVVLGSVLTVFTWWFYGFGDARGWWETPKGWLAKVPGVGALVGGSRGGVYGSSSYKTVTVVTESTSSASGFSGSAYGST